MSAPARTMEEMIAEAVRAVVREELSPLVAQLARATPEELLSVEEAAERAGVSVATIRRQVKSGALPSKRVGRQYRIPASALKPHDQGEVVQLAHAARFGRR